jgi:DNA-binding IclR family transcriptional regulator
MERSSAGDARSLHRALDVLEALASAGRPLALGELSERVGARKPTAHRLLATLTARGYASQDTRDGRYSAGIRLFELGSLWAQNLDLRFVAAPHLDRLNEETGETVHLAVYDHGDAVYIDKRETRHAVVASTHVGRRCPAYCVATGRVLLAHQPAEAIADVLAGPLPRHTERTTTDPGELAALLEDVRRDGFAVNRGSLREGVGGIAAPIRDHTGAVVAAVGCCLPESRFGSDRFDLLRDRSIEAAAAISRELGGHVERAVARQVAEAGTQEGKT